MTRSISITNQKVADTLKSCENASELVQVAILYYLNLVDEAYIEDYKVLQEVSMQMKDRLVH